MKRITKQIISIALTIMMLAGMFVVPAKASDTETVVRPEFSVRFMDSTGQRMIGTVAPGETFQVVISTENAEDLTGFVLRLHYDKSLVNVVSADWHAQLNAYETYACEGDEDSEGTALYPQKDINYDTEGLAYANLTWSLVNKEVDNSVTTPGMGDIDICILTMQADESTLGNIPFSIERLNYLEHGYNTSTTVEEEPVLKNTLKVEQLIEEETVPLTGFSLNKSSINLDLGLGFLSDTLQVISYSPENTTDDKSVTWKSENTSVATVNQKGVVTAVGTGYTTITATIVNSEHVTLTQTCSVVVVESLIGEWKSDSTGWWFQEEDGSYPSNCWAYIDGAYYYFNGSGYMAASTWIGDRYVGSDGSMKTNSWVGSYFVGADGIYIKNAWVDGGKYYVDKYGVYVKGWMQLDGTWYYLGTSGALQKGWIYVSGTWYYGDLQTGGLYESRWLDQIYYFQSGGAMATGWLVLDNAWYYFNSSGAVVKNNWAGSYWLGEDGVMVTSSWVDDGKYYVGSDGVYKTGWLDLDGTWYYLGSDGLRKTGWQKTGGYWYYMYEKGNSYGKDWGEMAYSCEIEGCLLDESGRWIN